MDGCVRCLGRRRLVSKTCAPGDGVDLLAELIALEGRDQVAREQEASPTPLREPGAFEMEGARFHRLADLESEPGAGCDRLAGDELAIEPGVAGSCHLLGQRQVRAHGARPARIAPGVLPTPRPETRPGFVVPGYPHIAHIHINAST